MKYKYLSIFLIILIFSIGAVSAQDNATDSADIIAASSDDIISIDNNVDILQNESSTQDEIHINDDNYDNYFDENGTMNSNISAGSTLYIGDITNKGLFIDKTLIIIPDESSNIMDSSITFITGSDGSVLRGLSFNNTVSAIGVMNASDISILDNVVYLVSNDNDTGIAIFATDAKNVNISGNTLNFSGKSDGYTLVTSMSVVESENAVIEDNNISIEIPSCPVGWAEVPAGSGNYVSSPISEGIIIRDSPNVSFKRNHVSLEATDMIGSYDTVYVLDISESDNAVISENTIEATGKSYIYGIIISGNDFTVSDNNITVSSDVYYANGIDIEGPATGSVENNNFVVTAPYTAYPIYSAMSNGDVSVDYIGNNISAEAYAVWAMELSGIEATVSDNNINIAGNYTTGIASRVNDITIASNVIKTVPTNVGNESIWDGFGVESVAIKFIQGNATVISNDVEAVGNGIKASGTKLSLLNNKVIVNDDGLFDSYAVHVTDSNLTMIENNINYTGATEGSTFNNAVYIGTCDVDSISGNNFTIAIPSLDVIWDEIPAGSGNYVSSPISEGIVFDDVSGLEFSDNYVSLKANNVITAYGYDTIYVIDSNSDNAVIEGNTIEATGADYIYGLIISGENLTVHDNLFAIDSASYSNGIDVEGPATGVIDSNTFSIYSNMTAYPIYAAMSNGDVSVNYTNNYIYASAYAVWDMEIGGTDALIDSNKIFADGNYTTGIAVRMSGSATITNNDISVIGSNTGDEYVWDGFGVDTVGIKAILGDITVQYNGIETTGDYSVITTAEGQVTDNYLVANELMGDASVNATDATLVENNIPANATNYNLTNDTFFMFFDHRGWLRDQITAESLTFIGDFSNLVDMIYITRPVTLLSENASLYNLPIRILSDNVTVDGFLFESDKKTGIIYIDGPNNTSIVNSEFVMSGLPDEANTVIDIVDSDNVLIDSNDFTLGVHTNETNQNTVIHASESDNLIITNNTVLTSLPARSINWSTGEVYSEGVCLDDCDNAFIANNTITVESNDKQSDYDTIYALHITGDNASMAQNEIIVNDAPYGYGIVMTGNDFVIDDNIIEIGENESYVCGIDVESNSKGIINNNAIIIAGVSAYGIYTADWAGDVKADITNNVISTTGNSVFGMSLSGSEALVEDNHIIQSGNFTTGIASTMDNITISGNEISDNASNEGTPLGYDTMGIETTGIHIVDGNAVVTNNNVTTTGDYAVDAKGTGQVTDNYLIASEFRGDAAVDYAVGDTVVANNTPEMVKTILTGQDMVIYYKNGSRYVVKLTDGEGNALTNRTVNITINGVSYSRQTNANGSTSIPLGLNSGNYTVTASYVGTDGYANASTENNIEILPTVYGDDLVKVFRNASHYKALFLDGQGNPLVNTTVTFNINGVFYERTTKENGIANLNIWLHQGEYVVTAINPITGEMHTNNVTVLSAIVNNSDVRMYYQNGSQYMVTIVGEDGNPVGAGVNVTFNINGVFYTRKTNDQGIARLNLKLQPGNYTITAEYNGCKVSNNIEILPILYANDLVKKYGTSDQFRALLVDGQGNPFPGQKITFNIHGVFYERTTNADGYAALNIKLGAAADTYIITSSYNGTSISNKIIITP